jgi:hypothetical protein
MTTKRQGKGKGKGKSKSKSKAKAKAKVTATANVTAKEVFTVGLFEDAGDYVVVVGVGDEGAVEGAGD